MYASSRLPINFKAIATRAQRIMGPSFKNHCVTTPRTMNTWYGTVLSAEIIAGLSAENEFVIKCAYN